MPLTNPSNPAKPSIARSFIAGLLSMVAGTGVVAAVSLLGLRVAQSKGMDWPVWLQITTVAAVISVAVGGLFGLVTARILRRQCSKERNGIVSEQCLNADLKRVLDEHDKP